MLLTLGITNYSLLPKYFIPLFKADFPNGLVYTLEKAGHYILEDEPEMIAVLIDSVCLPEMRRK
jgi:hypothetical protein